eukprot:CAMPEP_0181310624 /NCGR_PEP_ID=MMETSP1101-20121128/12688_1 /TAXON_ID=46948 /ORGANISM="Rhodomonas abbreviata, Strain Caron Lab Isolate" /LENGTH=105 /DNA_ID=CAMNT_0023417271 /DNA_START=60 /DNA_END=377 /DNA_ORIENTATION=-
MNCSTPAGESSSAGEPRTSSGAHLLEFLDDGASRTSSGVAERRSKCGPPSLACQKKDDEGETGDNTTEQPDFGSMMEFDGEPVMSTRAQDKLTLFASTKLQLQPS